VAYLGGFAVGVPVYVLRSYLQSRLALEWREGMTRSFLRRYMRDRSFYRLAADGAVDNPDQRIASDVRSFTDSCLSLSLTLLNAAVDLLSFSGILFGIYPPLFAALLLYAAGGTAASLRIGRPLVALNFAQEAREADLRYSLVRVRENAEAVAFYGGEVAEERALGSRLRAAVDNYASLLVASRNLDFFTSFYRFLIQLLPAAVVAPLFFAGKIEFGVVNQSQSAFGHVLSDVSLVVYQLEALAGFSAVVDRLGEFGEVVDKPRPGGAGRGAAAADEGAAAAIGAGAAMATAGSVSSHEEDEAAAAAAAVGAGISIVHVRSDAPACAAAAGGGPTSNGNGAAAKQAATTTTTAAAAAPPPPPVLLELERVSVATPDGRTRLVRDLSLCVRQGEALLVMGPSGTGKTSVLRVLAGLWSSGEGRVVAHGLPGLGLPGNAAAGGGRGAAAREERARAAAAAEEGGGDDQGAGRVLFLPQRPYMVLGSLRDQLLYPTWATSAEEDGEEDGEGEGEGGPKGGRAHGSKNNGSSSDGGAKTAGGGAATPLPPSDDELVRALLAVQLGGVLDRCTAAAERAAAAAWAVAAAATASATPGAPAPAAVAAAAAPAAAAPSPSALDLTADWAATLSLGEQQRLAFARLLLARPRLALLDEATSALDVANEAVAYRAARQAGVTLVSVGHRPSLARFHERVLRLEAPAADGSGCAWAVVPATDVLGAGAAGGAGAEAAMWGGGGGGGGGE